MTDLFSWADGDVALTARPAITPDPIDRARKRVRKTDPETSRAAARTADKIAADHYDKILRALRKHGPGTIYDIAEQTGLSHVQVARRLPEMRGKGFSVAPTNLTAASPTGRQCRVWGA